MHRFELGDCFDKLKTIQDNSIDMCLTDPPYFLDSLGDDWDVGDIKKKSSGKKSTVGSLPAGMKFDREQGIKFEKFMDKLSVEIFRVLKPGGFFISCSAARLYHRMAVSIENAGFDIRDMLGWTYKGQAKAFGMDHFIRNNKSLTDEQKKELIEKLKGLKTPQLMPCIEPMTLAQKPLDGTFINNWQTWGVGLMNSTVRFNDKFPGNIIQINKPNKAEKGDFNFHVSVKPVELFTHLISLFTQENATVLDPFLGSGTTLVACELTKRNCVGFEISPEYFDIIKQRYDAVSNGGLPPDLFEVK